MEIRLLKYIDIKEEKEDKITTVNKTTSLENITLNGNIIIADESLSVSAVVEGTGMSSLTGKAQSTPAPFVIRASTVDVISSSRLMFKAWSTALYALKALEKEPEISSRLAQWGGRAFPIKLPEFDELAPKLNSSIPHILQLRVLRLLIEVIVWEGEFS